IQEHSSNSCTYGHSQLKTGHPVRSAIHKQLNGRLVLRWVTTWESLLLYVLHLFCILPSNHLKLSSFLLDGCFSIICIGTSTLEKNRFLRTEPPVYFVPPRVT
ncbi:hypothetical protein M436DRAFT_42721, partial [Aureobasidium namibiae CBS 147.97]